MLQVFDRVISSGSVDTLVWLTGIALSATALYAMIETVRRNLLARTGDWIEKTLAPPVLREAMSMRAQHQVPHASLADIQNLRAFFAGDQILAFFDAPWMPIFIALIWVIDPLLGSIAILGAFALFSIAVANDLVTRKRQLLGNALQRDAKAFAQSMIDKAETAVSLGMSDNLLKCWSIRQAAAGDSLGIVGNTTSLFLNLSRFLRLSLQIFILGAGAWLVLDGRITSGGMIAASIILTRALSPVERSISAWRGLVQALSARRNLVTLFAAVPPEADKVSLPRPEGRLDVIQVRYSATVSDRPLVKKISFSLSPGQVCGIVGPSGSGKSSLCRLLSGLWTPQHGHIRLDGADIVAWGRTELARHIGYLPQQVDLFTGTVAQNIARMGEVDSDKVVLAARQAGVHEMIVGLKDGYETKVGQNGTSLSGGQKQRIGLARALYNSPRVLILDEPNASLDSQGERALQEAIRALKAAGHTILIVSHELQSLGQADRILMLKDGVSVAFGPKDEVLRQVTTSSRVVPMSSVRVAAVKKEET